MLLSTFRSLRRPLTSSIRASCLSTTARVAAKCPSCLAELPSPLPTCPNCRYIAPIPNSTSFQDMLGLPEALNPFRVDGVDLRRRFLEAQRVCHPDTWAGQDPKSQAIAVAQSSQLNKAYQTLLSPLQRAHYILQQNGLPSSDETEKIEDPDFIMEVMEAREEVENAETVDEVEELRTRNNKRINAALNELDELIGAKRWEETRSAAVQLKYWDGIEAAAKERIGNT